MAKDPLGDSKKPFFRGDQVGSLLRPEKLLQARAAFDKGTVSRERLREVEDEAIEDAVRLQENIGLEAIVDGEFRRQNWWIDFIGQIGGVEIREGSNPAFRHDPGQDWHYVPKNVMTVAKLHRTHDITAKDFEFLRQRTRKTPKVTLPSPTRMHFYGGCETISRTVYPEIEYFFTDVARVYQEEIATLEALGCRYIQIDDPNMTYFANPALRAKFSGDDGNWQKRLSDYVALVNRCIAGRSAETTLSFHLCRGNSRSSWMSEGSYDLLADIIFSNLHIDTFFLEYDDQRSGGLEPLRYIPQGKRVVLGLITTKHGELEDKGTLRRRIDEAAHYVPLEHLAISPQCGFASVFMGNLLTQEDQIKKLELVVETAHEVWGGMRA